MDTTERQIIDGTEALEAAIARARAAEREFSLYTQEKVDAIFKAAAIAANMARVPLAKMAVEETGMGVVEDKVIKNNYAAEYIYYASPNRLVYDAPEYIDDMGEDTMAILYPDIGSFRDAYNRSAYRTLDQDPLTLVHSHWDTLKIN